MKSYSFLKDLRYLIIYFFFFLEGKSIFLGFFKVVVLRFGGKWECGFFVLRSSMCGYFLSSFDRNFDVFLRGSID